MTTFQILPFKIYWFQLEEIFYSPLNLFFRIKAFATRKYKRNRKDVGARSGGYSIEIKQAIRDQEFFLVFPLLYVVARYRAKEFHLLDQRVHNVSWGSLLNYLQLLKVEIPKASHDQFELFDSSSLG